MSALEIATDLYRTLWTATDAKKEDKILNGRSKRDCASVHLIMIVCKMKMLSDNRDKIESIPVSLRVLGFE